MKKLYFIELLRFLSSLAVVITHYIHFYHPFNTNSDLKVYKEYLIFENNYLPFYHLLENIYRFGYLGVFFFWQISGFVLAYTYFEKNIKFKTFIINRFSRLYPLHILTLLFVIISQFISIQINGEEQIIINNFYNGNNNLTNFASQLFFLSGWFENTRFSYNFPVWSVSIEIIVYLLFFLTLIFFKNYKFINYLIIFLLFFLFSKTDLKIFFIDCARYFFSGVILYILCEKIKNLKIILLISIFLLLISLIGNFKNQLFFSSAILLSVYFENILKNDFVKNFSYLGNLTYSSYLIHIPIQILVITIFRSNNEIYTHGYFLLFYIILIYLLSHLCYFSIELPLKNFIRNFFKK